MGDQDFIQGVGHRDSVGSVALVLNEINRALGEVQIPPFQYLDASRPGVSEQGGEPIGTLDRSGGLHSRLDRLAILVLGCEPPSPQLLIIHSPVTCSNANQRHRLLWKLRQVLIATILVPVVYRGEQSTDLVGDRVSMLLANALMEEP